MSEVITRIWTSVALMAVSVHGRLRDEKGQTTTEYVVLLAAILALGAIIGVATGTGAGGLAQKLYNKVTGLSI
jgi:hypothetical protein